MPVQPQDIKMYLSGGSSNTDPSKSTGGPRSNTQVNNNLNSIFTNVEAVPHSFGQVILDQKTEYRVLVIKIDTPLLDSSVSTLTGSVLKLDSDIGDLQLKAFVSPTVNTPFDFVSNDSEPTTQNGPINYISFPNTGIPLPTTINPGDEIHIAFKKEINQSSEDNSLVNILLSVQGNTI